ncbi:unnamed protein product [Aureobasidium pullulans]|nr:unnamed protein product [Aureobasidium pullulans]
MEAPPPYPAKVATPNPENVTPLGSLSSQPAKVDCAVCKAPVMTRTTKNSGDRALMWGAILCVLTGCLCWLPCVMDECKDTRHTCSNCGRPIATVTSNGGVQIAPGAATVSSQYERRDESMVASGGA